VLVDAVDQGAVEVEQEDGPSHGGSSRREDRVTAAILAIRADAVHRNRR
jgi:hypothetical protein